MPAPVDAPGVTSELPVQRVRDLEHVLAVEARVEALVALVVGARVQKVGVHELVVVAVEGLTDENEVTTEPRGRGVRGKARRIRRRTLARLAGELVGELAQAMHEAAVERVGHVEAQAVDAKVSHPAAHAAKQVVHDGRIGQIELHELVVALPALVPEAVAPGRVAIEANAEPVLVRRVPTTGLHVQEGPEAATHVIEHGVEHHAHTVGVQLAHHVGKVGIGAEAPVDAGEVACVVAVGVALEHGVEQNRAKAHALEVGRPVGDLVDGGGGVGCGVRGTLSHAALRGVRSGGGRVARRGHGLRRLLPHRCVLPRHPAEAERVDLIERRLICPHASPSRRSSPSILARTRTGRARRRQGRRDGGALGRCVWVPLSARVCPGSAPGACRRGPRAATTRCSRFAQQSRARTATGRRAARAGAPASSAGPR